MDRRRPLDRLELDQQCALDQKVGSNPVEADAFEPDRNRLLPFNPQASPGKVYARQPRRRIRADRVQIPMHRGPAIPAIVAAVRSPPARPLSGFAALRESILEPQCALDGMN